MNIAQSAGKQGWKTLKQQWNVHLPVTISDNLNSDWYVRLLGCRLGCKFDLPKKVEVEVVSRIVELRKTE